MGRPYTGWDGNAPGKRAGLEKFVQLICFLSGNTLWNNGTWSVRPMNNANAKARPSVHGTGRAADLSWRLQKERRRGGSYADCEKMLDFLVQYAEEFRIEEIHDYHYGQWGRGWRCDRAAWRVYEKNTIGSPGGDWIHVEISPEFADNPGYYDNLVKQIMAGEIAPAPISSPAPAPISSPAPAPAPAPKKPKTSAPEKSEPAKLQFDYPGQPIKLRSRNSVAVKLVQAALGITADGKFGPQTKGAVEAFQRSKGLVADGIVGQKTWTALFG